jgi:hypothetical protein
LLCSAEQAEANAQTPERAAYPRSGREKYIQQQKYRSVRGSQVVCHLRESTITHQEPVREGDAQMIVGAHQVDGAQGHLEGSADTLPETHARKCLRTRKSVGTENSVKTV